MAEGTVECANCGRANPAWAQVCRSCGAAIPAAGAPMASTAPSGPLGGVDQGSLLAIGGALGTVVAAIVIGVIIGGILPPAPVVVAPTPTPNPSASLEPTPEPSIDPSASGASGSGDPSATPAPVLPGTLTFGLGLNAETQRVINPTDTFTAGTTFAHSIELTAPFGVTQIAEAVARVNEDGTETQVISPEENPLQVDPEAMVDGFTVPTNALLEGIGAGTYIMRVYRGSELLAQGTFILVE